MDDIAPDQDHQIGPKEFRIGFLVHDVSRVRRTLFDSRMKPLGITRSQWWALAQLSRSLSFKGVDGMLQTELAEVMDIGKVTVGGLIDRLEASGFVKRKPDEKDRRAKRIVVTKKGEELLERMATVGRELNTEILAGIQAKDVKLAEDVLARIKENIINTLEKENIPLV